MISTVYEKLRRFVQTHSRVLLFLGVFALFFVWSLTRLDPDFGWHVRSGQFFLDHGIPKTDIYTYTAHDFPWVNHEWLSDSILALVNGLGGYWLAAAFYAAMWTVALMIAGKGSPKVLIAMAALALLPFLGVRALAWSMLGLALLMLLLRQKNHKWRLFIPLLFLGWANVHGSFLIGVAYGGWQVLRERSWRLAAIGIMSLCLTIVNPYGIEIYTEVFRTMFDAELHGRISEWARFAVPLTSVVYMLVWVGVIAQHGRNWKEYIRFDVLLFVLSAMSMRMTPLFILVSLPYLAKDVRGIWTKIIHANQAAAAQRNITKTTKRAAVGVCALMAILTIVTVLGLMPGKHLSYPKAAVAYLQDRPCEGRLFNSYNYGGYLIWQLPSHQVYIDGRMPSWSHNGTMWMEDYLRILKDDAFRREQFLQYGITCALIEKDTLLAAALTREGWRVAVEDDASVLLLAPRED